MLPILSLFLVLVVSMVIVRLGAVALRMTGMSNETARFQARSAFSGAGFTTTESEQVVNHPMRRRIISLLILSGSVGITAASSTVILSVIGIEEGADSRRLWILLAGIVAIGCLAASKFLDRLMCGLMSNVLNRYTELETHDFTNLLHLGNDFHVTELLVEAEDWLAGKSLIDAQLRNQGVLILGATLADGSYLGLPEPSFVIEPGQSLVLYGEAKSVDALSCRCDDDAEPSDS